MSLRLDFAAENAERLSSAFKLPGGCGIPDARVQCLLDEEATKHRILKLIESESSGCLREDTLIVYFSGHGEVDGTGFYLLPVDTVVGNLGETAIEARDLNDALASCVARGILLILDCCHGAGFAEHSDELFRKGENQEFRILLSASRAKQSSYEFSRFRGTIFSHHLTNIVSGRASIGDKPGIIYFSDVLSYLTDKVSEDLERLGHPANAQEIVFAGTYGRDPRLFILQKVALETLDAETPRYSKKFVRGARRKVLQTVGAAALLVACAYYFYLDHMRYLGAVESQVDGHNGTYIAIFAGDPRANAMGFPHLVEVTDIPVSAISNGGQSDLPKQFRFTARQSARAVVDNALPAQWQAILSGWAMDVPMLVAHYSRAESQYDISDDPAGLPEAIELVGNLAGKSLSKKLEDDVTSLAPRRAAAAIQQLARLEPNDVVDLYNDGMNGQPIISTGLLLGLTSPCPPGASSVLEDLSSVTYDKNRGRSLYVGPDPMRATWWAALLRSGCELSATSFIQIYDQEIYRDNDRDLNVMAYLISHPDKRIIAWIRSDLLMRTAHVLDQDDDRDYGHQFEQDNRIWSDLRVLVALKAPEGRFRPQALLSYTLSKNIKLAATRMVLSQGKPDAQLLTAARGDLWIASALVDSGWYDVATVEAAVRTAVSKSTPTQQSDFADAIGYFLRMVRRRRTAEAKDIVNEIGRTFPDEEILVEVGRTLDALEATISSRHISSARTAFFADVDESHVLLLPQSKYELDGKGDTSDAYPWYVSHYDKAFIHFETNMYDSTLTSVRVLSSLKLSESALDRFRQELSDSKRKYVAAALLAAKGSLLDLRSILESPDIEIRQEGENYAILNKNFAIAMKGVPLVWGRETMYELRRQSELQSEISNRVDAVPIQAKGLVMSALVRGSDRVTPGLQIWADAYVASLDGETEDDARELRAADTH